MFTPVSAGRISGEIVGQIKRAILGGQLTPGDRLPSERELAEQFGVSRVTVRDALRILEASGLIEIRVGARGGAIVTRPGAARVGEGLTHMLVMSAVTPADVTEARLVFEIGTIALICERANDDDIAALTRICERSEAALADGAFHVGISAEFHTRLALATHNPAIAMIMDSFQEPLIMSLRRAKETAPQMGVEGTKEHWELVRAIAARDVDHAEEVMRQHLLRTAVRLGATNDTAAAAGA